MKIGKVSEKNQTSAKIINEATGTALIIFKTGDVTASKIFDLSASTAPRQPKITPREKPKTILPSESKTAL